MVGCQAPNSMRRATVRSHTFASMVGRSGEEEKGDSAPGEEDFYEALKWWGPQCSALYLAMRRGLS
jgi:hypothetical protein